MSTKTMQLKTMAGKALPVKTATLKRKIARAKSFQGSVSTDKTTAEGGETTSSDRVSETEAVRVVTTLQRMQAQLNALSASLNPSNSIAQELERMRSHTSHVNALIHQQAPGLEALQAALQRIRAAQLEVMPSQAEKLRDMYKVAVSANRTLTRPVTLPLDEPDSARLVLNTASRVIKTHSDVIKALADR